MPVPQKGCREKENMRFVSSAVFQVMILCLVENCWTEFDQIMYLSPLNKFVESSQISYKST